ncbi:efflux RND transporter periplasmic adaptor subunit [Pedobacter sp. SD-b]|uniref:Efflux RND transporter periplasmic adaptor subunit n=1 Tax=Pedobacter segetis TaxID=2793069 RepID=A0ABS1BJJ9_9SPHI|nr:HlyD family efflux transporter periplasmic adaptor subunit [Pedobacter segetis]MBK0382526.1 efflux RND transporter periplasmic adaptor subunit [Pedobacter segetis]
MSITKHKQNMREMWRFNMQVRALGWKVKLAFKTVLCFLVVLGLSACEQKSEKSLKKTAIEQTYTCSMHPQVVEDKPGQCPLCGMDLVLRHQQEVKMQVDASLSNLIQPTNENIVSNIKTYKVIEQSFGDSLFLNGKVTYNTNNMRTLSARVGGRIEKLYVRYNFEKVNKGQKLMEIYSPELAAAQQELLFLLAKGDVDLLAQAKTKLRLLGIEEPQINQIISTRKVNYRIPVFSNASGYVMDAASNTDKQNYMPTENTAIALKEGAYIKTGDVLFKVFDDNEVWGEFYANPNEATSIKKDESITISTNHKKVKAKIDLIQPYFNEGQNFNVLRVYLHNSDHVFKIGEILKGKVVIPAQTGLWVPSSAVYQLGNRSIVFIKKNNVLTAKEVEISRISNGKKLTIKGLKVGDEIADNASYLIDTESFIKIN